MLRKTLLLTSVCLALSACMLYAPTYVSQPSTTVVHVATTSTADSHDSNVKQKTTEVSKRVASKATTTKQRPLAVCGAFTLPREVVPEYLTEELMATAKDVDELDTLVGMKVKELQTYIDSMHSKIEQAHAKWLESCQQKLLD